MNATDSSSRGNQGNSAKGGPSSLSLPLVLTSCDPDSLEIHPQILQNSQRFYPAPFVPAWHLALLSQLQARGINNNFRPLMLPSIFNGQTQFGMPPCGYLDFPGNNQLFYPTSSVAPKESTPSEVDDEEITQIPSASSSPLRTSATPVSSSQTSMKGFSIAELLRTSPRLQTQERRPLNSEPCSSTSSSLKIHKFQHFPSRYFSPYGAGSSDKLSGQSKAIRFNCFPNASNEISSSSGLESKPNEHDVKDEGETPINEVVHNGSQNPDNVRYDWLQCTRYKPPKLPRVRRRDTTTRRKLGRNPRVPFTASQLAALETRFRQTQYLSSCDVADMSSLLCLTETRVKIWFQNRRARERRDRDARLKGIMVSSGMPTGANGMPSVSSGPSSAFSLVEPRQMTNRQITFDTSPQRNESIGNLSPRLSQLLPATSSSNTSATCLKMPPTSTFDKIQEIRKPKHNSDFLLNCQETNSQDYSDEESKAQSLSRSTPPISCHFSQPKSVINSISVANQLKHSLNS